MVKLEWKVGDTGRLYRYSFPSEGGMTVDEVEVEVKERKKDGQLYFFITSGSRKGQVISDDMVGKAVSGRYYQVTLEYPDDAEAKAIVIEKMKERIKELFADVKYTFSRIKAVQEA